jgi:hypothetical protein
MDSGVDDEGTCAVANVSATDISQDSRKPWHAPQLMVTNLSNTANGITTNDDGHIASS